MADQKAPRGATKQKSERDIVLDILLERARTGRYSNVLVKNTLDRYASLPLTERSFIKRLAEGTIEREIELDAVILKHLKRPETADTMKMSVRCLLRMSIYQIYYMDSVPDFAACNEAVRMLRKRHLEKQSGFVNGMLRTICREKAAAMEKLAADPSSNAEEAQPADEGHATPKQTVSALQGQRLPLGVRYSMPDEIVGLWLDMYGEEETEALLDAMMKVRPVSIRMNAARPKEEQDAALDAMRAQGVKVTPGRWLPYCYYLEHVPSIATLPGFKEGVFTVQDESSMMAAESMGLAGNETVIDVCAAPGGKSMHAASLVPDGEVLSFDLTKMKTTRIRENAKRLKLSNLTVAEHDATEYDPALFEKGDVVLCDVPCSGLGVITKKRDIKYNVSMEKIRSLVALQKRIMKNAVQYVKPGGVLIYSTCTIDRAENDKMAAFIEKQLGLVPDALAPHLPEGMPGVKGNHVQLLPHVHGTDGFYIARFKKPL